MKLIWKKNEEVRKIHNEPHRKKVRQSLTGPEYTWGPIYT